MGGKKVKRGIAQQGIAKLRQAKQGKARGFKNKYGLEVL